MVIFIHVQALIYINLLHNFKYSKRLLYFRFNPLKSLILLRRKLNLNQPVLPNFLYIISSLLPNLYMGNCQKYESNSSNHLTTNSKRKFYSFSSWFNISNSFRWPISSSYNNSTSPFLYFYFS